MSSVFFENQVLRNDNTSVAAADLIREAIILGRLKPGQRLKEGEVGRDLAISRTPVREALLMLQAEGLVELTPKKGATVRQFEVEDLDDTYELRAWLEGYAARRAAARITPAQLQDLRESCQRFIRLCSDEHPTDLVKENLRFHTTILEAAASRRLAEMAKQLLNLPLVYRSYYWYSPEQRASSVRYHERLVEAFERTDAEQAELLMRDHILEAKDFLTNKLKELPGPGA